MAEKNIIRQDIVQILLETAGVEDILNSETALKGLQTALGQLAKDMDETKDGSKKTGESFVEMAAKSEMLSKISDTCMEIVDAIGECVSSAVSFETSLAKLETIADTSAVPMSTLSEEILSLSNDTGVAAESLTESTYQAISASVDTASAVDFVTQANELAVGGFTSAETAVDVLSTAINAYGLEVSEAGQLSDYLITTQNLGKTSVDELAQSVGKVIPLASAYNVEMDNLSSAYAILTANGIATAEAGTYLKSMLNELADSGSSVAGVLQEETGMSFSELSASGQSLGDILSIIGTSVDNDATAFSNLWSSSEAGVGALSLLNAGTEKYNGVLDEMQNSTGAASEAYETMSSTAEKAQQRMTNAADNLKIAVGNGLLDTFSGLNTVVADVLGGLVEFAQEHETLVSALTVAVGAVAAVTAGFFGLSVAISAVSAAATALDISTGGVLKILGVVVGVAVSAVTAFTALNGVFSDGEEEVEDYDGTLEECRNEIELTEAALAKAKSRYGENSDAVKDLESDLDTLNKQYEKGGGYLGELQEKINSASEAFESFSETQKAAAEETESMQTNGFRAVSMLEALSEKSKLTNSDLDVMQSYADYLNDTFQCNIEVNYDTGELTGFDVSAITNQIIATANDARYQDAVAAISDFTFQDSYSELSDGLKSAQAELYNLQAAYENIDRYYESAGDNWDDSYASDLETRISAAEESVKKAQSEFEEADKSMREWCYTIDDTGELYDTLSETLRDGKDATEELTDAAEKNADVSDEQAEGYAAAQDAVTAYNDQLYELCEAYDKAYESALESIEGQYAIWDKVEDVQATSTDSIISALNSQNEYWTEYNDNLSALQERASGIEGLGDMLASMSDGSEESAAALAGLADASDAELATAVEAWQNLKQNQDDTANNMASVQTQFESALSNIRDQMDSCVDGMDKESEAYAAATSTMDGFIRGINDKMAEAQSALSSLTIAASQAANVNITAPVEANALGTTDSSDVFIAGENGAELIVGMSGSTVFPASETEKIIDAVSDYADFSGGYTPESAPIRSFNSTTSYAPSFYLTMNGGTSGANQKQVKRWMQQAMDDAFASVLRTNPSAYAI